MRLISGSERDSDPAWSPDKTKILFVRKAGRTDDVWIASADGSKPRMMIEDADAPDWEPVPQE